MFEVYTPFEKEVWLFERSSCQLYPMVLIVSIILLHLWNKVKIEDRKLSQLRGRIHTLPRNFIKPPKMMGLDLEARFIMHRLEKKNGAFFWAGFQPAFPGCCCTRPQDLPKKWQIRPATWCTGDEDVHVFYVTCSMFDSSTLQHNPTGVGFCVFFLDLGRKQKHCQLGRLIEHTVFRFGVGKFPWR